MALQGVLKKNLLTVGTGHASSERLWRHGALHHLMVAPKAPRHFMPAISELNN